MMYRYSLKIRKTDTIIHYSPVKYPFGHYIIMNYEL